MKIRENVPISELTTMRIGGPTKYLIEIEETADIPKAYHFAAEKNLPVFILGGGANTIGHDEGFDGVIIKNTMTGIYDSDSECFSREHCARNELPKANQRGACAASPVTTGASVARSRENSFQVSVGDATNFKWSPPIDAVACEGYLGAPMSKPPVEIKLKEQKQECGATILGFLKNLSSQIKPDTPVVIAVPAWLRPDGTYSRLEILDFIKDMGYNVKDISREGLLYHRDDQIVARDIIILRKN